MDISLTVTLAAVFVTVALVVGSITNAVLERTSPARRRLDALVAPRVGRTPPPGLPLLATPSVMGRLERFVTSVPTSPKDLSLLRRRLTMAGY